MSQDTSNFLFGLIQIKYPAINALIIDKQLPLLGRVNFSVSKLYFQFLFYLGLASSSYFLFKGTQTLGKWFIDYVRSCYNSKKFLASKIEKQNSEYERYYAVIYGAGNRAGNAFAHYLATKGFNLILIERDLMPLNDVEISIKQMLKKNTPQIIKIVLNKFDQDALSKNLDGTKDLPIKLFINCKNAKRKCTSEGHSNKLIPDLNDGNESDDVDEIKDPQNTTTDVITREEVYFTGKENIEGLSCLLNIYLGQMIQLSQNPAILNINNDQDFDEHNIKKGQLFYQASVRFQDTFTTLLQRQMKGAIKTINVKANFKKLKEDQAQQYQMCEKAFCYLGIKDTISIK
ncbi:UNKNOWN [Stylonychia lemnae]|uniref:Uncharacterized protein n=1 Tax=Stylonychia lemnae TaxID=5949 RepID=A0A078AXT2_STYLE|nr:UNKNOWN [Stylonychia lemnae]|eukprot:CDW86984.1 UNKNOWN [Stylonychia lemnae]